MGKDKQRRLARARNVVKKWERAHEFRYPEGQAELDHFIAVKGEIAQKRYERACALILADKIANS